MSKTISELTTKELIACYNSIAKIPVTKFRDHKTGEAKLNSITAANKTVLLEVYRKIKVDEPIIVNLVKEINEEARKQKAEEQKASTPAVQKKTNKAPKVAGVPNHIPKTKRTGHGVFLTNREASTLGAIQKLIPVTGTDDQMIKSSEDIAATLGISNHSVIPLLDALKGKNTITVEDDTTDGDAYYYVSLTELGRVFDLPGIKPTLSEDEMATSKKEQKAQKTQKAPKAPATSKEPRARKANSSEHSIRNFPGKKIYKLFTGNPCRAGGRRAGTYDSIREGMNYDTFVEKGGNKFDLWVLVKDGKIEVK